MKKCREPNCMAPRSRWSNLCSRHKAKVFRHGDPSARTIRVSEVRHYLGAAEEVLSESSPEELAAVLKKMEDFFMGRDGVCTLGHARADNRAAAQMFLTIYSRGTTARRLLARLVAIEWLLAGPKAPNWHGNILPERLNRARLLVRGTRRLRSKFPHLADRLSRPALRVIGKYLMESGLCAWAQRHIREWEQQRTNIAMEARALRDVLKV